MDGVGIDSGDAGEAPGPAGRTGPYGLTPAADEADPAGSSSSPGPSGARRAEFFGTAWPQVSRFADLVALHGEERGLIGPRELPRLWVRHILNSAALADFLPVEGSVIDVGSGVGLPGIILAAMRPDLRVHLVEPMQRRVAWLQEVSADLDLGNVTVHGLRAEDLHGRLAAEMVTARAVAALDRLARLTMPLVAQRGRLVVLKGRRAADEVDGATTTLRRLGAVRVEIHEVDPLEGGESTTVVEVFKP
jgi:16S rRNA (guanine527-N7)-methyltransferase